MDYPTKAAEVLQQNVYSRAFFEKLSRDWNIVPKTAAERTQLLQIAHGLKQAQAQTQEKQASTGNEFLASALSGLNSALESEGINTSSDVIKEAAFNLTQDAEIAHAGLALAEYLVAAEAGAAN